MALTALHQRLLLPTNPQAGEQDWLLWHYKRKKSTKHGVSALPCRAETLPTPTMWTSYLLFGELLLWGNSK